MKAPALIDEIDWGVDTQTPVLLRTFYEGANEDKRLEALGNAWSGAIAPSNDVVCPSTPHMVTCLLPALSESGNTGLRWVLFDFVDACNAAHRQKRLEKMGSIDWGAYDRFDLVFRRAAVAAATADRTLAAIEVGFDEYLRLFAIRDCEW